MRQNPNDYLKELEFLFDEIKRNHTNTIVASNKIIEVLNEKIHTLHIWLSNYTFASPEEEIQFFKEQKPILVSKLIYYKKIKDIESNLPTAKEYKIKFLKKEIDKINLYTKENSFFNEYYRSCTTENDLKYFTRNRDKNLGYYECHIVNYDFRVSTSHDYNVAQILGNDQLIFYLEDRLDNLLNNSRLIQNINSLNWTGTRIDLIELIYSLHTQKVFNDGECNIKELALFFGQAFNIDIEESIYKSYGDIKNRKSSKTKFLNSLIEKFSKHLDEEDA
jgi:hypothetical protein